jgi:hypothetical protein
MTPPIDTSVFELDLTSGGDPEEGPLLAAYATTARAHIESRPWAPPIKELLLAYGVGGILGLFLVQFTRELRGELEGETEMWIVVGDLPTIPFDTEVTPTPALALKLYCAICQDWADTVLTDGDLSDSYPIPVAATHEHAEMLLSRIEFVREKLMPIAAELGQDGSHVIARPRPEPN